MAILLMAIGSVILGVIMGHLLYSDSDKKANFILGLLVIPATTLIYFGVVMHSEETITKKALEQGAKAILAGKAEVHYMYKDSVCVDTIIEIKDDL